MRQDHVLNPSREHLGDKIISSRAQVLKDASSFVRRRTDMQKYARLWVYVHHWIVCVGDMCVCD